MDNDTDSSTGRQTYLVMVAAVPVVHWTLRAPEGRPMAGRLEAG
jgi:hypothetical protein